MIRLSSYPDDMIGGLAANAATGWSIGQLLPQVQGVVLGWRPLRDTVAESTVADVAAEKSSASGHLQRPRRDKQPPLDIDSTGRNAQIAVIHRRLGERAKTDPNPSFEYCLGRPPLGSNRSSTN